MLVRREEALPGLHERYPHALFYVGDAASKSDCNAWIVKTIETYGQLDLVINNAAITGPGGKLDEVDFTELEHTVCVDLLSPLFLCARAIPHLLRTNGVVINLAGGGATGPRPNFTAYAISKVALVRATENLALEYPELRFYGVSPGLLNTNMMKDVLALGADKVGLEVDQALRCQNEGGEDPRKAAELALWLFENRPTHLSGKLISAIWDDYRNAPAHPEKAGWWTLRRVDDVCRKNLSELPREAQ